MKGFVVIQHDMCEGKYIYDAFADKEKAKAFFEKVVRDAIFKEEPHHDDLGNTIEDILKDDWGYTIVDDVVYEVHPCGLHLG